MVAAAVTAGRFLVGSFHAVFGRVVSAAFNAPQGVTAVVRTVAKPLARETLGRAGVVESFYLNEKVEKFCNLEDFRRFHVFSKYDHANR